MYHPLREVWPWTPRLLMLPPRAVGRTLRRFQVFTLTSSRAESVRNGPQGAITEYGQKGSSPISMKRYVLSGPVASGKTSLLRMFESEPGVLCVGEQVRILAMRLANPQAFSPKFTSPERQGLLLSWQMGAELQATLDHGSSTVVCDRGLLDTWVYTKMLFPQWCDTREGQAWGELVDQWTPTYAGVVLLPMPAWGCPEDDVRKDGLEFQEAVGSALEAAWNSSGVRVLNLTQDSTEKWKSAAANFFGLPALHT